MNDQLLNEIQATHIAIWNERSRPKRDELTSTLYSENIKMYDPGFTLTGVKDVSDFIDKVQSDAKFVFKATQPMDGTQNGLRLFWSIETSQGVLTGMDFFILDGGKVEHLYVFMKN